MCVKRCGHCSSQDQEGQAPPYKTVTDCEMCLLCEFISQNIYMYYMYHIDVFAVVGNFFI